MAPSRLLKLYALLTLAPLAYALAEGDLPLLNSTTPASTTSTETETLNPHTESSAIEFDQIETGSPIARLPDVGSIISTLLPSTSVADTDNPRKSRDGAWRQRIEASETDFGLSPTASKVEPRITTPPIVPPILALGDKILRPIPVTSIAIGDRTLVAGGETATLGDGQTKIHLDESGQPVVVVGSSTSTKQIIVTIGDTPATLVPSGLLIHHQILTRGGTPFTLIDRPEPVTISIDEIGQTLILSQGVTSTLRMPATQAFTIERVTATAIADQYKFEMRSTILGMEIPITVDSTIISLGTDSTGATIIVAGSTTMVLSPAETRSSPIVRTTVVSGTTQFIIGSQTLAPGHPITVGDIPMSLSTASGATVLVVGTMTTTIVGSSPTGIDKKPEQHPQTIANPSTTNANSGSRTTVALLYTTLLLAIFTIMILG